MCYHIHLHDALLHRVHCFADSTKQHRHPRKTHAKHNISLQLAEKSERTTYTLTRYHAHTSSTIHRNTGTRVGLSAAFLDLPAYKQVS